MIWLFESVPYLLDVWVGLCELDEEKKRLVPDQFPAQERPLDTRRR
jgi:hypothetical protein